MVEDGSVDVAFSFDSLVHVELDVLSGYLEQLARKLRPDGVGFLHHSNIGSFRAFSAFTRRVPRPLRRRLVGRGVLVDVHSWRAESVTAERVARACDEVGLVCIAQERISWEYGPYPIDALTLFTRPGSRWERERRVMRNPTFGSGARRLARLYAGRSFPSGGRSGGVDARTAPRTS